MGKFRDGNVVDLREYRTKAEALEAVRLPGEEEKPCR
jgi:hypothetical protein